LSVPYVSTVESRWSPILQFLDQPGHEVFVNLPGNSSIGRGEPYVCIAPVLNFYLLSEQRAAGTGEPWVLGTVPEHVVEDLQSGRCLLLLDLSNEAAPYVGDVFDAIHSWAGVRQVPTSSILLVTQNRRLEAAEQSRHGAASIGLACYDYFVLAIARLFALDDASFEKSVGFHPDAIDAAIDADKQKRFLCLNATARPHRAAFVALLGALGIRSDVLLSFHGNNAGGKVEAWAPRDIRDVLERLDAMALLDEVQSLLHAEPVFADIVDKRGNELYDAIDLGLYAATAFSLITETEFSDGEVVRVTEKTVKALCLGHPALVVGNPFSLELVRELGFETFSPFLDESYDVAEMARVRFALLAAELTRLTERPRGAPLRLEPELQDICRSNARHARGGLLRAYRERVEAPFVAEVRARLARLC
jgi:hypothetical protein